VGGTTGAGGVILNDDLVDGGRQVNKKIVFKVSGGACEVGMVGLRKLGDPVDGGQEVRTQAAEGFDDAGDDCFALRGGVASKLIFFTGIRCKASGGKGCGSIP